MPRDWLRRAFKLIVYFTAWRQPLIAAVCFARLVFCGARWCSWMIPLIKIVVSLIPQLWFRGEKCVGVFDTLSACQRHRDSLTAYRVSIHSSPSGHLFQLGSNNFIQLLKALQWSIFPRRHLRALSITLGELLLCESLLKSGARSELSNRLSD